MFMVQELTNKPTRSANAGNTGRTIIMIGPRDLTTECLVEVLAKNFPDNSVLRRDDVADITAEEDEDARLVLIYRPPSDEIWDVVEQLHDRKADTAIGILVESIDEAEDIFHRMSDKDIVDGVVPLDLRLDVFLAAIRLLAKGGEHFPSALLQRLRRGEGGLPIVQGRSIPAAAGGEGNVMPVPPEMALTTREIQILDLLCKGTQNKIIADRLRLSENTVKVHIRNIYKKMRVRNRTEAAARFFRNDLPMPVKPKAKS